MDYDFSSQALYHPETRPAFLGFRPTLQFDPGRAGFSAINAWWLANAAHLAYFPPAGLSGALGRVGLELVATFDREGTQGFLAAAAEFAVLSFRGTEVDEFRDLLTDLDVPLVSFPAGGRVHRGFLLALDRVWTEVSACLDVLDRAGRPVWFTGHSLGAALATLAAARRRPAGLATFGSPLVGDATFAPQLAALEVQRFVNCCDIVPTVPPAALGYRHVGQQFCFTAGGRILLDPSNSRVARIKARGIARYAAMLPWLRRGMVKLRSLADHSIVNYSAALYRNLAPGDRGSYPTHPEEPRTGAEELAPAPNP